MTFAGVRRNVLMPDDQQWDLLFGDEEMGEGAQRKLNTSRIKNDIVPYIVENPDAFFSSLTLIMVPMGAGGPLQEGRDYRFTPDVDPHGTPLETGLLDFEDHVLLFPADGMHRSGGIIEALAEGGEIARRLADQRISVVLIPYHQPEEVRQLFADLNRNAKPVSQTVALNYEIRDPVVILSKRLASEVPLFHERVNMTSNSLAAKSPYVIALNTLVTANTELLAAMLKTPPKQVRKHGKHIAVHPLAAELAWPDLLFVPGPIDPVADHSDAVPMRPFFQSTFWFWIVAAALITPEQVPAIPSRSSQRLELRVANELMKRGLLVSPAGVRRPDRLARCYRFFRTLGLPHRVSIESPRLDPPRRKGLRMGVSARNCLYEPRFR
jgi:DGQHR domain-containing protein